jgi:gluconolactonase
LDSPFEVHDPAFRRLVPQDQAVERIATGFAFTEGPVWNGDQLLFSDIPNNRIVRWRELPEGPEVTTFRCPSGFPLGRPTRVQQLGSNGLTLDRQGRLLACEHGNRRVTRTEADGSVVAIAERWEGKRLNSPNDVVVRSDGAVFFTDPPYGLVDQREGKELPFQGVYRIDPDGSLDLLVDDFERPNGLAFSPDERTLHVDDTARRQIRAFDVTEDGRLEHGRIFADLEHPDEGGPDGMKVDVEGNVYCTGPGATWVFNAAGALLGRIITPERPANCAWGGADWRTLYFTARPSVYRLRVTVPGIPVK